MWHSIYNERTRNGHINNGIKLAPHNFIFIIFLHRLQEWKKRRTNERINRTIDSENREKTLKLMSANQIHFPWFALFFWFYFNRKCFAIFKVLSFRSKKVATIDLMSDIHVRFLRNVNYSFSTHKFNDAANKLKSNYAFYCLQWMLVGTILCSIHIYWFVVLHDIFVLWFKGNELSTLSHSFNRIYDSIPKREGVFSTALSYACITFKNNERYNCRWINVGCKFLQTFQIRLSWTSSKRANVININML